METIHNPQVFYQPFELDVLKVLRIVIYFYLVVKILEIMLTQKRKTSAKQRITKRFQFAHQSIIGTLDHVELGELEATFKNTVANIEIKADSECRRKKGSDKKVVIINEEENKYYDHIEPNDTSYEECQENMDLNREKESILKNEDLEQLANLNQTVESRSQEQSLKNINQLLLEQNSIKKDQCFLQNQASNENA